MFITDRNDYAWFVALQQFCERSKKIILTMPGMGQANAGSDKSGWLADMFFGYRGNHGKNTPPPQRTRNGGNDPRLGAQYQNRR